MHINCSDSGSTGKIIRDINKCLKSKGVNSVLCTPSVSGSDEGVKKYRTSLPYEQGIYRRLCRIFGLQFGFAPISTCRIISIIKKENPDIVHIHSANSQMVNIYRLLSFLKKRDIPTVITNHAEFFYTGSCSYTHGCEKWKSGCGNCDNLRFATGAAICDRTSTAWKKMKACFDNFNKVKVVSVSPWITSRAKQSPIMHDKAFYTIINGVDTDRFYVRESSKIKKELSVPEDAGLLLHVTSNFTDKKGNIKGGNFIIELAERLQKDNVYIIVAGRYNISVKLPPNIIILGSVLDQNRLAELYSAADATVITSKHETFSMPVAESLCCGTPVAGFKAGGPESITIDEFSQFVEYADLDALERALREKWLGFKSEFGSETIAAAAREKYDYKIMAQEYYNVYSSF